MTKLEIACVVCGLIGILVYQPTHIKIENSNIADYVYYQRFVFYGDDYLAIVFQIMAIKE